MLHSYGQSKTANVLFAVGLTKRFAADGIISSAVMPGVIATDILTQGPPEYLTQNGFTDDKGNYLYPMKTVEEGASTQVWAAVAPELANRGAVYLENCAISPVVDSVEEIFKLFGGVLSYAVEEANAEKLWDVSEKLIAQTQ